MFGGPHKRQRKLLKYACDSPCPLSWTSSFSPTRAGQYRTGPVSGQEHCDYVPGIPKKITPAGHSFWLWHWPRPCQWHSVCGICGFWNCTHLIALLKLTGTRLHYYNVAGVAGEEAFAEEGYRADGGRHWVLEEFNYKCLQIPGLPWLMNINLLAVR